MIFSKKVKGFSEERPNSNFNGNFRHFFGGPRDDLFTGKDIILEVRRKEELNPDKNPLKNSLMMHIDKICTRMAKLCKQKKLNILEEFQNLDPDEKGKGELSNPCRKR